MALISAGSFQAAAHGTPLPGSFMASHPAPAPGPAPNLILPAAAPQSAPQNTPTNNTTTQNTPTNNTTGNTTSTVVTPAAPAFTPVSQATIDAIMASIANHVTQNQNDFNTAQAANAADDITNENTYNNQVQTNTGDRATAVQNAEQAAATGNQGLRAVLANLGALSGTGEILAGRAVANSANSDIGGADKTYQTNANAISGAKASYDNAKADRDNALHHALDTDNQTARATGIQDILNDAKTQGDIPTYNKFLPQLVQATAPSTAIAATHSTYNPAAVTSFAPTSGLRVTAAAPAAATTPVNSALYVKKQS